MIILTFLLLIIWAISLITPYFNSILIDYLAYGSSLSLIYRIIFLIIIVSILNIMFSYLSELLTVKIQAKVSYHISFELINRIKQSNILDINKYDPIYLTQRINDDSNNVVFFFLNNYFKIILNFGTIIFVLFIFLNINKNILLISILSIPFYFILYKILSKPLFEKSKNFRESKNVFFKYLSDQLIFLKNIKINSTFKEDEKYLNQKFSFFLNDVVDLNKISYLFSSLDGIVTLFLQVGILIFGAKAVINKTMTIGEFTIIMTYYSMLIGSFKYYIKLIKEYQDFKVSNYRIKEITQIDVEKNGDITLKSIEEIELKNATFTFSINDKPIIFDFNNKFIKDNIYIIKGENGSGKTTLIEIILGLYNEKIKGEVSYNNISIKKLDLYTIRREIISVVQQEPRFPNEKVSTLFKGNINLLKEQIKKKNLSEFFLNDKFDIRKLLDKSISNLSGGEKQKIAILKAILKESDVLILDEPTSALDSKNIEYLKELVLNLKNKILIIITHDKRLYEIADYIINLDNK